MAGQINGLNQEAENIQHASQLFLRLLPYHLTGFKTKTNQTLL